MAKRKRARAPSKVASPRATKTAGKQGITTRQLLNATPAKYHENAKHVRVTGESAGLSKSGRPQIIFRTRSKNPTTNRKPENHRTVVRLMDRGRKRLWVSCTCENFMYFWEYALAQIGASSILFGNGEPPVIMNPSMRTGGCKHVIRVLQRKSTVDKLVKLDEQFEDVQH